MTLDQTKSLAGKRVVVIGALPFSLLNFRADMIKALQAEGATVHAMSAPGDPESVARLKAIGVTFSSFSVSRTSFNPITDFITFLTLAKALFKVRPDHVIAYTIKPVIYGGLASKLIPGCHYHALITGLGIAFEGGSLAGRAIGMIASFLYRIALSSAKTVFFQNTDDRKRLVDKRIVREAQTVLVPGTGVNLQEIPYSPMPAGPPVFLMVARLLKLKGVLEFCEAATRLHRDHPDWRFVLVGTTDPSPDSITEDQLNDIKKAGVVECLGFRSDIVDVMANSHVFVLPTYYPEGRPRTIQEALAVGRPVITTDMPGCRDAVDANVNGWLIPARDVEALYETMSRVGKLGNKLAQFGQAARTHAENKYDVKIVNDLIVRAVSSRQ